MVGSDQAHRPVVEREARFAALRLQAILQVIDGRVRHGHRAHNLQQRWRLDHLHVAPKVPRVVAQVAVPAAAGPRLQFERKRRAIGHLAAWTELVQNRLESHLHRSRDLDLVANVKCRNRVGRLRFGCHDHPFLGFG